MTAPASEGLDRLRVLQDALEIVDAVAANMNGAPASTSTRDADVVAGDLADAFDVAFDENWPGAVIDVLRATPPEPSSEVVGDTVAFVQEWLMNADYDPTQFDKDFAAAIDARCASRQPTPAPADDAEVRPFYDAVKAYSYPSGREVLVRIHQTGWDVYDPDGPVASPKAPSVATGAGEVERLTEAATRRLGFRRGIIDEDRVVVTRSDLQWALDQLAALAPASASIPADVEREALAGYRAAVSFIAADAWDGCGDCIEVLRAAREADWQNDQAADPNGTARQLARIRTLAARPSTGGAMDGEGDRG